MKRKLLALLVTVVVWITGCTSIDGVPAPMSFPAQTQYKLKAVAHWQLIAKDLAAQIKLGLEANGQIEQPIYVQIPAKASAFESNFLPLLRSELLKQNLKVNAQESGAATMKLLVDNVRHTPTYRAGTLTILGGGLLALRDASIHNARFTNAGGAMAAIAADLAMSHHQAPPELELVLTLSLQDETRYIASLTQIYYLSSDDKQLYELAPLAPPIGRIFEVTGASK